MARTTKPISTSTHRAESLIATTLDRLAAILLRAGLDSPAAEALLRQAFIRAATRSASATNRKTTQSQIASIAGVSRLEVRRVAAARSESSVLSTLWSETRLERLVMGWSTDRRFLARNGKPQPLGFRGANSQFDQLVRRYGRDVTKKTLRLQLIRRGIARESKGRLILMSPPARASLSPAVASDLKYVASQLSDIDFELGRRAYLTSRISILAQDKKSVRALRRIASTRLETALNSLASMAPQDSTKVSRMTSTNRLLVSTTIAIESEDVE